MDSWFPDLGHMRADCLHSGIGADCRSGQRLGFGFLEGKSDGPAKLQTTLLVDDDPKVRSAFGMGYHVEMVARGSKGIKQVAAIGPGLVLMDGMMPAMDGY